MTKKGPFFGPQNVRKSRRAKMGLPSTTRCVDPLILGWPGSHGVERCAPPAAPGACGGPCFCVVFAFLAWPCTGRPKHTSGRTGTA